MNRAASCLLALSLLGCSSPAPPSGNRIDALLNRSGDQEGISKAGNKPVDSERRLQRCRGLLREFPPGGRVSKLRTLFPKHQSLGVKSIKDLTTETWEIDEACYIVFKTEPEDIGSPDPRVVGTPELHRYTWKDSPPLPRPPGN